MPFGLRRVCRRLLQNFLKLRQFLAPLLKIGADQGFCFPCLVGGNGYTLSFDLFGHLVINGFLCLGQRGLLLLDGGFALRNSGVFLRELCS